MAIASLDGYIAAVKQRVQWIKTGARTTVAAIWFSLFDIAGAPGAGTLAGSSTAAGVVPTDATAGCPAITDFAGGATGYLTTVDFGSNVACRIAVYDLLFKAGAYSFNSNVTLAAQPSYSGRVPGADYKGLQIWIETVTAFTGNLTVTITYTNQDGTTGRSTGSFAPAVAPTVGRLFQVPLQAGDSGVQKIESVAASVATVGTFNVLVLRPLWTGRVRLINDGDTHGLDKVGLPIVFQDSALFVTVNTDSTASGVPELQLEVASG